jgi:hypothetical protein
MVGAKTGQHNDSDSGREDLPLQPPSAMGRWVDNGFQLVAFPRLEERTE